MSDVLKPVDFKALEDRLRRLLEELPAQIARANEGGKTVELDQQSVGRLSRIDAIAQQSVNQAGLRRLRLRLGQVRAAIRRIDQDEYGICLLCEEFIALRRLEVSPETAVCVKCQESRERA